MTDTEARRQKMIQFAEQHLAPFELRKKGDGTEEIVPDLCPFCQGGDHGDRKSFALSIDYGVFVCKRGSCGKRGRFESLCELFNEECGDLFSHTGSSPAEHRKLFDLPDTPLFPPTEKIYAYFENRKISRETVDAFRVMSDPDDNIVFPFYENGEIVFEKFRRPEKYRKGDKRQKEWRVPNTKAVLFGMDDCVFSKPLIITEGQVDAMSLYEAGIRNVVSVPSGCEDMSWVEHCWDWLEHFKSVILFGDNDEPGQRMVREVAKRLDESRCMIVDGYPQRPNDTKLCKDANEILYFYGEMKLIQMVEEAKEVPVRGLVDLGSVAPSDPTAVPRIKTCIPKLDEVTGGLLEGGISVIVGRAGSGKSCLSNSIILNAINQGYPVCLYTGEFTTQRAQYWLNLQAAGSDYLTLKYDPIKGKEVPVIPYRTQERIIDWYKGRLFLYDNDELSDGDQADSVLKVFTAAVRRYGVKLFVVDNLMTIVSDKEDETAAQRVFANKLKRFAKKYDVAVLLVAHARKTKAGEKLGADDLSGASATNNLADLTMAVEPGRITILKNREEGTHQIIEFCYCPDSKRIYQADVGDLMRLTWNTKDITPPAIRADSLPEYQVVYPMTEPF